MTEMTLIFPFSINEVQFTLNQSMCFLVKKKKNLILTKYILLTLSNTNVCIFNLKS